MGAGELKLHVHRVSLYKQDCGGCPLRPASPRQARYPRAPPSLLRTCNTSAPSFVRAPRRLRPPVGISTVGDAATSASAAARDGLPTSARSADCLRFGLVPCGAMHHLQARPLCLPITECDAVVSASIRCNHTCSVCPRTLGSSSVHALSEGRTRAMFSASLQWPHMYSTCHGAWQALLGDLHSPPLTCEVHVIQSSMTCTIAWRRHTSADMLGDPTCTQYSGQAQPGRSCSGRVQSRACHWQEQARSSQGASRPCCTSLLTCL